MNQIGFIERAIETCTSDLFNQVKKLAMFNFGAYNPFRYKVYYYLMKILLLS